jgi:hypothetical protein
VTKRGVKVEDELMSQQPSKRSVSTPALIALGFVDLVIGGAAVLVAVIAAKPIFGIFAVPFFYLAARTAVTGGKRQRQAPDRTHAE